MPQNAQELLEELTAYPSTEHPFLSVYLDWQPDGTGQRQSLKALASEFSAIDSRLDVRGPSRDSFDADRQRIMEYLDNEAPRDANGLAIFACNAEGVWFALPLMAPVPTKIIADRHPHVFELARILDDHETYAVVVAEGQEARIFVVALNRAREAASTEAPEEVNRTVVGGWSQMRYQRHIDEIIKAHMRDVADRLGRLVKRYDVQHVVIAANDSIKGAIVETLPDNLKAMVVDFITIDPRNNVDELMAELEPLMRDVERQQEADDVDTLEAQVNTKGGLGVVGVRNVAQALSKGQVRLLIMQQDFEALGSMNPNTMFLYDGFQRDDPYDGSPLEQVNLREQFTARAAQQGATIQIVDQPHEYLAQHEGVGALLWYNDTVEQPHQREQSA
jgi:peptide subunit release factor 1 (eRF1)